MLLYPNEVAAFQKMFQEARILSAGTESALYWVSCRSALAKGVAQTYRVHHNVEYLFQAAQLHQLGESESIWNLMEKELDVIRNGGQVQQSNYFEGTWAVVFQDAFGSNWEEIDRLKKLFFNQK